MYLDTLSLQHADVGHRHPGTHSNLGYEGILVQIQHRHYQPAFSTHLPVCQLFDKELNQHYTTGGTYA